MYHGWICFNIMFCSEQQRKQDRGCQRDIWDPSGNIKVGFSCPVPRISWAMANLLTIYFWMTPSAIGCSSSLASPLSGCSIQDWTQRPLPYVSGSVNRLKKREAFRDDCVYLYHQWHYEWFHQGANPEALATIIRELRRESNAIQQNNQQWKWKPSPSLFGWSSWSKGQKKAWTMNYVFQTLDMEKADTVQH